MARTGRAPARKPRGKKGAKTPPKTAPTAKVGRKRARPIENEASVEEDSLNKAPLRKISVSNDREAPTIAAEGREEQHGPTKNTKDRNGSGKEVAEEDNQMATKHSSPHPEQSIEKKTKVIFVEHSPVATPKRKGKGKGKNRAEITPIKSPVQKTPAKGNGQGTPVRVPRRGTPAKSPNPYDQTVNMSPATVKKWPLAKEERLCQLWEEEPLLHDQTNINYKKSDLREAVLRRFSAVLDMSVEEVNKHLKSLRTIYRKIEYVPSGSGANRLSERNKQIKRMCGFLRTHLGSRKGRSNLKTTSPQRHIMTAAAAAAASKSTEALEEEPEYHSQERRDDSSDTEPEYASTSEGNMRYPNTGQQAKRKLVGEFKDGQSHNKSSNMKKTADRSKDASPKAPSSKQAKRRSEDAKLNSMVNDMSSSIKSLAEAQKKEPDDYFDLWAKSLAIQMRAFPKLAASRLKLKIDTLMLEAEEAEAEK